MRLLPAAFRAAVAPPPLIVPGALAELTDLEMAIRGLVPPLRRAHPHESEERILRRAGEVCSALVEDVIDRERDLREEAGR